MVGILGLFMTFNHLLLLYYWIVQLLFVLLLYMYFVEHDINQKGQSNNPTTLHVPVLVENQLSSESSFNLDNVYVHVIIVTSMIAASHSKWSEISPNMWEVGLFFFLPFGLQRFLAPYTQTSNVYHGLYLVCLCILVIFILYKAFTALTVVWELLYKTITRVCFMINTIGWFPVFVYHWRRVNLAQVLLVSWLIKFTSNLVIYQSVTEKSINWAVLSSDFCECCVSFVDLIAVGVVVSNISKYALWLVRLCLRETTPGQQHGNHEGEGWNLGFVFFLLALQCGLTEAKSAERFVMIGLILVIILSLLVQSAFEIAEPSLATLGVTYTGRLNFYHVRVLAVSLLLLFVSVVKVSMLFGIFQLDPWLIALVFSDMDNIVQIIGALAVYILFIVNVHLKTPWEELDDYIYYVKAVCKVFEFLVALSAVVMCVLAALSGHWNLIGELGVCFGSLVPSPMLVLMGVLAPGEGGGRGGHLESGGIHLGNFKSTT